MHDGLKLYRHILKLHSALPKTMKELGNKYIREEFNRHLYPKIQNFNKAHYMTFLECWQKYADDLKNPEIKLYGRRLTPEELAALSPAQKETLNSFKDKYFSS
ncbi:hypothetical protein SteCoe_7875 [Stentor coeruleus]|uniref:Succinate dehydrogenase assembly factor 3 n=1 Tax=Stentor coeruleus TaxID=5963 RepID=A0A1R2CLK0_9CILI|nr:hypothetical protein SteCoe_7875 [Stentor coeruleus]